MKHAAIAVATTFLLVPILALAQSPTPTESKDANQGKTQKEKSPKKDEQKFSLTDATRINTEEAARSASRKAAEKNTNPDASKKESGKLDSVTEFSPAPPDTERTSKRESKTKRSGPKIHGEAHGGLDPANSGTHQTGGAVGATTKGGKTSVYVNAEQNRSTTSSPH